MPGTSASSHRGRGGTGSSSGLGRIDTTPSYVTAILPAVLLIGVGWIGFPAVNIQATSGIEDDEQGLAAGVLQTSMQVDAAIVLAVTTAITASGPVGTPTPASMLDEAEPEPAA